MDSLFGIPTNQLTLVLLAVFAAGALILAFLAARDRTSLRMAIRNIPRRRAQSVLIVAGLTLATALFSAAFTTGDTLTNSLRNQALDGLGRIDVVVKAEQPDSNAGAAFGPGAGLAVAPETREKYFDGSLAGEIRDRLSGVSGVAPLAKESVPVTAPKTDLSEPRVDMLGMDPDVMSGFDRLRTKSGKALSVGDLEKDEVYVSRETAGGLVIGVGDTVEASLARPAAEPAAEPARATPTEARGEPRAGAAQGSPQGPPQRPSGEAQAGNSPPGFGGEARPDRSGGEPRVAEATREPSPPKLKIAGIYEGGANPGSDTSMVMPLEELQKLVGEEGKINEVLITHEGPEVEGGEHTDATVDRLGPILSSNSLEADPVKKDAVDEADRLGERFSTLFVLFGQFSVAAGMLLIFVMLAAERKRELGIARAVGMQRSSLIRAFAFEGALYALAAAALGSVLGIGWLMVRFLGRGFAGGNGDLRIAFAARPRDVVLAFCMGMVLTFVVVLLSSWRVSRLNMVRAIRDIPEPDKKGRSLLGIVVAVGVPLVGAVAFWQYFATDLVALYLGGLSLMLIGLALLARVLGVPDRVAFTASALVLLALWLTPASITTPAGMARGPEMFFVSGIALVVAGVWLVVFNADAILWLVVGAFGWMRGLPPVLKTAVKYPTQSLFRTGMALAKFMLVPDPAVRSGGHVGSGELLPEVTWWHALGGLASAFYVCSTIVLFARLGAVVSVGLFIAGQMLASLALDGFWLLGVEPAPIGVSGAVGALAVVVGAAVIVVAQAGEKGAGQAASRPGWVVLAFLAGAVNALLRVDLGAPITVGAISFVVATDRAPRPRIRPLAGIPWWGGSEVCAGRPT